VQRQRDRGRAFPVRRRAGEIERLLAVRFDRWGELDAKAEAAARGASSG